MMYEKLMRQLEIEEGHKLSVYRCSQGFRTIGIGHNLDANPNHFGSKIPDHISQQECEAIFVQDVHDVVAGLTKAWPEFSKLDPARRDACLNMAFQMGVAGFMQFVSVRKLILAGDWEGAYRSGMASKWAKQTPLRAKRVMSQIRDGKYYEV